MSEEAKRLTLGFALNIFGGVLIGGASVLEVAYILSTLGLSIFEEIKLTSELKVFLSLCIFLGLSAATLSFTGAYLLWKGYSKAGGLASLVGGALSLSNLIAPFVHGFGTYEMFPIGTFIGFCLVAAGVACGPYALPTKKVRKPLLTSVEVATVAVFSALYAVMIILVAVPSPTGGYTHIGDIVVFVAALLFGYRVGGLVGVVGAVAADLFVGYPRWFISFLAHGIEGVLPGLAKGKNLAFQAATSVLGGFLMAATYFFINIFIKGYPLALISFARDLFVQAGVSIVVALIIVNIVRRTVPQFK